MLFAYLGIGLQSVNMTIRRRKLIEYVGKVSKDKATFELGYSKKNEIIM